MSVQHTVWCTITHHQVSLPALKVADDGLSCGFLVWGEKVNAVFSTKKLTYVSLCEQCLFFEKCSIYCRLHLRAIIRVLCQYFAAWIENCCRCYRRPRPGILLRSF